MISSIVYYLFNLIKLGFTKGVGATPDNVTEIVFLCLFYLLTRFENIWIISVRVRHTNVSFLTIFLITHAVEFHACIFALQKLS